MNSEIDALVHRQIILDMTIRTLERDRKYVDQFKVKFAFEEWIDEKIKELKHDLNKVKSQLYKQGTKIQSEERIDELITEFTILFRGMTYKRRYMNIALRNWVNEEAKRLLNLPYRTL